MPENNEQTQTEPKTYSEADFNKVLERAQNFEGKLKDIEKKIVAYAKFGDPEAIAAKLENERILAEEKAAAGGKDDINRLIETRVGEARTEAQKILDAKDKELGTYRDENEKLKSEVKDLRITDRIFGALAPSLVEDPGVPSTIKGVIRRSADQDEQGEFYRDLNGEILMAPGKVSVRANEEHFIEYLQQQFPSSFRSNHKSGTQEPGSPHRAAVPAGGSAKVPKDFNNWSQRQKEEWMKDPNNRAAVRDSLRGR